MRYGAVEIEDYTKIRESPEGRLWYEVMRSGVDLVLDFLRFYDKGYEERRARVARDLERGKLNRGSYQARMVSIEKHRLEPEKWGVPDLQKAEAFFYGDYGPFEPICELLGYEPSLIRTNVRQYLDRAYAVVNEVQTERRALVAGKARGAKVKKRGLRRRPKR